MLLDLIISTVNGTICHAAKIVDEFQRATAILERQRQEFRLLSMRYGVTE